MTRKHKHAPWDADTLIHTYCISMYSKHSLPKLSTVMPSHSSLDKLLCEADEAEEGTQQPEHSSRLHTTAQCSSGPTLYD